MSFELGTLISPAIILGVGVGFGLSLALDKFAAKGLTVPSTATSEVSKVEELQSELDANRESQAKVDDVHAYARKLEEKIQQLESVSDSADAQLRVKVLEKQLSEKADLESKLAVAIQQLEDYEAKADMFDTVVGAEPVEAPKPVEAPQPAKAPEPEGTLTPEEIEKILQTVSEPTVSESTDEITPAATLEDLETEVVGSQVATANVDPIPTKASPEPESVAAVASAVASANVSPGMTVVENENSFSGIASPSGSTAPAIDERPALRVESNPSLELGDPFEKIEGLEEAYKVKLYEAGIRTFAQLAASSPSRITEIVEPQSWETIDIMKWRREAALFAAGEKE